LFLLFTWANAESFRPKTLLVGGSQEFLGNTPKNRIVSAFHGTIAEYLSSAPLLQFSKICVVYPLAGPATVPSARGHKHQELPLNCPDSEGGLQRWRTKNPENYWGEQSLRQWQEAAGASLGCADGGGWAGDGEDLQAGP
jgi:hypothetical protein